MVLDYNYKCLIPHTRVFYEEGLLFCGVVSEQIFENPTFLPHRIERGSFDRGIEAADHANGKPTPMASSTTRLARKSREKSAVSVRRPKSPKDGFDDEDESAVSRIIQGLPLEDVSNFFRPTLPKKRLS